MVPGPTRALAAMAVGLACVASADPAEEPWVDQLGLGPWQEGRATFYGNEEYNGDTFSIDEARRLSPGPAAAWPPAACLGLRA